MKLKPLGAKALVKMIESDEQTVSGIVLPDTAREKPQTAEVVAVGDPDEVKVEGEHLIVDADDVRPVRADGPTRSGAGRSPPPGGADARRPGGARQDPAGPPRPRCGCATREGSAGDPPSDDGLVLFCRHRGTPFLAPRLHVAL
jgi:chaperonin GroES